MNKDLLIARVGGERIAMTATEIQSVIELGKIIPVPGAPAMITGLTTQRSRTLTVIDVAMSLGLAPRGDTCRFAIVVELEGIGYALAVDAVESVLPALGDVEPVKIKLSPGWARSAAGMVETSVGTVLLVDLARLVGNEVQQEAA